MAGATEVLRSRKARLIHILSADADFLLQHADSRALLSACAYKRARAVGDPCGQVRDVLDHVLQRGPGAARDLLDLLESPELQETFPLLRDLWADPACSGPPVKRKCVSPAAGPLAGPPADPAAGPLAGPPADPAAGPLAGPPAGPAAGPPAGPLAGPPADPGAGPLAGPPADPGAGPPADPAAGPLAGPPADPGAGPLAGPPADPAAGPPAGLVTEKQLMKVARVVGRSWKAIGRQALEIPTVKLEQVEEDHALHVERVFAMLRIWRSGQRDRATAARLHSLLSQDDCALPADSIHFLLDST